MLPLVVLVLFLEGRGLQLYFGEEFSQMAALPNGDVGGYAKLFGYPLLAGGWLFGGILVRVSVLVLMAAGVTACAKLARYVWKKRFD
ncbi:hypothetical protein HMPREF1316_0638 [Olsenella profusa F0195]|uniref:Uncharacterized protein n=2 Tax=Olsenella profusa TaxID=138595 RepID=U2SZ72_9ACTN|nr:hypothetical protein HMPREF1316_0638 [Olsenella profusa F0195]